LARVLGNYVGINPSVAPQLGNRAGGIAVLDAPDNLIGAAELPNRIGANIGPGILVAGARAVGNQVGPNDVGRVGGIDVPDGGFGVVVRDGAILTRVEGARVADGIRVWGPGTDRTVLEANTVDAAADIAAEWDAIEIDHGARNTDLTGNKVRSSARNGVRVGGAGTDGTLLRANSITGSLGIGLVVDSAAGPLRTDQGDSGESPAPNLVALSRGAGVSLSGRGHVLEGLELVGNLVGAELAGGGHRIVRSSLSRNRGAGVVVLEGLDHEMTANRFEANLGLAIDLGGDGPTPNDPLDADSGPNGLVNSPRVAGARLRSGGSAEVDVAYDGRPDVTVRVELYGAASCAEGEPIGAIEPVPSVGGGPWLLHTSDLGRAAARRGGWPVASGAAGIVAAAIVAGEGTSELSRCQPLRRGVLLLPWVGAGAFGR
jgi:hypothetical protein